MIHLSTSDIIDEHAITARAKLARHALAMERMLATIMDALGCSYYDLALSIITMLSGDQEMLSKLKEHLESEKKLTA